MRRVFVAVAFGALAAAALTCVSTDGLRFGCDAQGRCDDGLVCHIDKLCYRPEEIDSGVERPDAADGSEPFDASTDGSTDDGGFDASTDGGDAGKPDAGDAGKPDAGFDAGVEDGGDAVCPPNPAPFVDPFDLDSGRWKLGNEVGSAAYGNGVLSVTAPNDSAKFARWETKTTYPFDGGSIIVEIPDAGPSLMTFFQLELDPDWRFAFELSRGNLVAIARTDAGETRTPGAPERWLQIRESGGQVFFFTSAERKTWTFFAAANTQVSMANTRIVLGTNLLAGQAFDGGLSTFDNLNVCGP